MNLIVSLVDKGGLLLMGTTFIGTAYVLRRLLWPLQQQGNSSVNSDGRTAEG